VASSVEDQQVITFHARKSGRSSAVLTQLQPAPRSDNYQPRGEPASLPAPGHIGMEIPLNGKTLAASLRRSRGYVAAMKSAGYKFTHGTRTLLSDALNWLAENPDFRVTGYRRNAPGFVKRRRPTP
jgi:hypothetical protein